MILIMATVNLITVLVLISVIRKVTRQRNEAMAQVDRLVKMGIQARDVRVSGWVGREEVERN